MCGIAGRITKQGWPAQDWTRLRERFLRSLAHRGPDDHGCYQSPDGMAGMVHTRLSVLDLSPTGHQPMATEDGRFVLIFNGEIYNYRHLRARLESTGEQFRSQGDTEVVLRGLAREGRGFLRSLRGMFALALWDAQERRLLLARDPLGIKPLYYHLHAGQLLFASELQALLATGQVPRRLDGAALSQYFLYGSVPEPLTLIEGVRSLPAGAWMEWRAGEVALGSHWDPRIQPKAMDAGEAAQRVRAAVSDSIAAHLVSDVPVGVFLSGGLDSTLILSEVSRHATGVQTFTMGFEEGGYNEASVARRTAAHLGATHHERILTAADGKKLLNDYLEVGDQPSIDGFNTYCVSRLAREHSVKVVLSGVGGDELFGGYPSFQQVPRIRQLARQLHRIPRALRRVLAPMARAERLAPKYRRLLTLAETPATWNAAYWCQRGIFTPEEAGILTARYLGTQMPQAPEFPEEAFPSGAEEGLEAVSWLELTRYLRNQLLRDSDVMSMVHSLELRTPLVDVHLLGSIWGIPPEQRLAPGKQLLKEAFPELPRWVLDQPKRGFVFPFQQWMERDWKPQMTRTDSASPVRTVTWYRRWALFALDRFIQKHHMDGAQTLVD